jgi:glycosyltransferase involved in cell wall biosynthesis
VSRYELFQSAVFPWFERVLFASLEDAAPPFVHLPNAVSIPKSWSVRPFAPPLELLFVGNPEYLPNRDALDQIEHGIVPAIEDRGLEVRFLHPRPDEDVSPFYKRAHVAAVPLRAGGGTRIKLLEAFAHGCPVVSTPTGARGLALRSGRQLMITKDDDDVSGFAEAVIGLARDERRREALAATARSYVAAYHDFFRTGAQLAELVGEVAGTRPAAAG